MNQGWCPAAAGGWGCTPTGRMYGQACCRLQVAATLARLVVTGRRCCCPSACFLSALLLLLPRVVFLLHPCLLPPLAGLLAAGQLEDRTKPILFSMARLDKVKNLTGLVSWFAGNQRLRELVNLVIVGE